MNVIEQSEHIIEEMTNQEYRQAINAECQILDAVNLILTNMIKDLK